MNKYVVMTGRDDVVVLNADDSKSVKAYIAKGYGITNRIKSKHPLEMSVAKIISVWAVVSVLALYAAVKRIKRVRTDMQRFVQTVLFSILRR